MRSGQMVPTVQGMVSSEDLGWILPHEHVVTSGAGMWTDYPELLGDTASLEGEAVSALTELADTPFNTVVDLSTHDLGRNVRFLQRVSSRAGVHLIVATGCWLDPPRSFYRRTPSEVAQLFIRDLTVGVEATDVRAGVVKVASEGPISPQVSIIFQAAAIAAGATGAPIYTHSSAATRDGVEQLEILTGLGVPGARICIGHSNDTRDPDYLEDLASSGCFIGLDRLPGDGGIGLEDRIDLIVELRRRGLLDRILLSHDWAVRFAHSIEPREGRRRNAQGYRLINDTVFPALRAAAIPEEDIMQICRTNPIDFLTGART